MTKREMFEAMIRVFRADPDLVMNDISTIESALAEVYTLAQAEAFVDEAAQNDQGFTSKALLEIVGDDAIAGMFDGSLLAYGTTHTINGKEVRDLVIYDDIDTSSDGVETPTGKTVLDVTTLES